MIQLADDIIDHAQTAFIPGRFILDWVVVLHEILNEVHRTKSPGVVLKVDFEKAYDKINWEFLEDVMYQKGFSQMWIDCMLSFVCGGKVDVKVNDKIGLFLELTGSETGRPSLSFTVQLSCRCSNWVGENCSE